ncbi:amidase [Halothiobacillus neapolitanus]|uniref:Amidase n=1 Tax=Halothiobacillus neapolitanus (strain ATCC 23641 / DSM 15147 / CIP 104769 / NCIMB 8539 / c2) TaxID=555778 RepID=D0KZ34_HALNC|nr:amidase [Halothiobacillus neapolitanus]ACX95707.1 Amidase [Halothiobacillus neapolitanus c2]TDN66013.1 aspartyl-tRNA(Asn)/glutamyl-tRNA(Gln) amidotransferase subunit A [Halothiobacillus neapolitanus]
MNIQQGVLQELNLSSVDTTDARLCGLRVGVKDLFDIAGIPTSAGNPDWLATHAVPEHTAPAVLQLMHAGAHIVAKTLTDELAYSLNGINTHYGTPINAASPERLPGGSSSGSAAMVAHGLADIGLGTDTGGSIRVPSSYNGLFGLRPTHGVISVEHMVGLAPSFDTVGWMTRDLGTLADVADVLLPEQQPIELKNLCILKPQIDCLEDWDLRASAWLATNGPLFESIHEVVVPRSLLQLASQTFRILQGAEIWHTHGAWVSEARPRFAADIRERMNWCQSITSVQIEQAARDRIEITQILSHWLDGEHTLAILPTTPGAAPLLTESAECLADYRVALMGLTALAGLSSRPQLHLPVLSDHGAPWGLSLIGHRNTDRSLIGLAHKFKGMVHD